MFNPDRPECAKQGNDGVVHKTDQFFMQRALTLAARGQGYTSPNPVVGAVIVQDRQIVGEGYHHKAGEPHAEVEALRDAGEKAHGSTLYVTLEPCNHYGRTPPCTEAVIAAGIQRVVYAVKDPNPLVAGSGHRRLLEAGIAVTEGVCAATAWHLNRSFFHYIINAKPYVIAKFASSLDGKIATRTGDSRWISGQESRKQGHLLRHSCDAILVGAGTAVTDNPQLTARIEDFPNPSHPTRVLLDSRGRVPLDSNLFSPDLPGQTIVAATDAMPELHRSALVQKGIELLILPSTPEGKVDLLPLLEALGKMQIISLLVEGGGEVLASFITSGLVDEIWAFIAPIIIGGDSAPGPVRGPGVEKLAEAFHLQSACVEQVGNDFLIKGYARKIPDYRQAT